MDLNNFINKIVNVFKIQIGVYDFNINLLQKQFFLKNYKWNKYDKKILV